MQFEPSETGITNGTEFIQQGVDVNPSELTGNELEIAFAGNFVREDQLTRPQRTYLNNAGFSLEQPQGEVNLNQDDENATVDPVLH